MPLPNLCADPYLLFSTSDPGDNVIRIIQTCGTLLILICILIYTWNRSKPQFTRQDIENPVREARTNVISSLKIHQSSSGQDITTSKKKKFQVLPIYERILVGGFIYCNFRAIFCILILSKSINIHRTDSGSIAIWVIWALLDASRYWVLTFVTFLFLQRSSGALAFRRAILFSGLLTCFQCSATYIAIRHTRFEELAIFDGTHVILYLITLWYICDLRRNRWRAFYFYVGFFMCVYIVQLTSELLWINLSNTYCTYEIGYLLNDIGGPIMLIWLLVDDSTYWRRLGSKISGSGSSNLTVAMLEGTVEFVTPKNYKQVEEILMMQIPVIDMKDLVREGHAGLGSFASVYKARYILTNELFAVKQLTFSELTLELILSYCKEAFLSSELWHQNVVRFKGLILCPPQLALCYEYCSEGSLQAYLFSNNAIAWNKLLRFALDAANGIKFLHDNGIIHRDINSRNILVHEVSPDVLIAKVCDFGIARKVQKRPIRTYTSFQEVQRQENYVSRSQKLSVSNSGYHMDDSLTGGCGTVSHMPPELIKNIEFGMLEHKMRNKYAEYDYAVDVFAFGIVLWEILTRSEVYPNLKTQKGVQQFVLNGNRPEVPDFCPGPFARLMTSCWDTNPSCRPSFLDIVIQLEAMADSPVPKSIREMSIPNLMYPKVRFHAPRISPNGQEPIPRVKVLPMPNEQQVASVFKGSRNVTY